MVIRVAALAGFVLLLSACGLRTSTRLRARPCAGPDPVPEPDLEPDPVELTATMTVNGEAVSVGGTTNHSDGGALVWALAGTTDAFARMVEELGPDREGLPRFPDGEIRSGSVAIESGGFALSTTSQGWENLSLREELPPTLIVGYLSIR